MRCQQGEEHSHGLHAAVCWGQQSSSRRRSTCRLLQEFSSVRGQSAGRTGRAKRSCLLLEARVPSISRGEEHRAAPAPTMARGPIEGTDPPQSPTPPTRQIRRAPAEAPFDSPLEALQISGRRNGRMWIRGLRLQRRPAVQRSHMLLAQPCGRSALCMLPPWGFEI